MKGAKQRMLDIDANAVKCHMRYIKRTSRDPRCDIDYFKRHLRFLSSLKETIRPPWVRPA